MREGDILHNIELLEAAIPYVSSDSKPIIEVLAKGFEFIHCIQKSYKSKITTCSFKKQKFDLDALEPLLSGIRPVCNEKERAIVDRILSMFNAKRMFEMYNTYMSAMQAMGDNEDQNNNDSNTSSNDNMIEVLKSMVPPEQQDTIENLSMLFDVMSYDNNDNEDDQKE